MVNGISLSHSDPPGIFLNLFFAFSPLIVPFDTIRDKKNLY